MLLFRISSYFCIRTNISCQEIYKITRQKPQDQLVLGIYFLKIPQLLQSFPRVFLVAVFADFSIATVTEKSGEYNH